MQKSDHNQSAVNVHRKVQSSTTLNRKYVKRPSATTMGETITVRRSQKVQHFKREMPAETQMSEQEVMKAPEMHPLQATANEQMMARSMAATMDPLAVKKMTAKEIKEQEIKKALNSATKSVEVEEKTMDPKKQKMGKTHFGFGRVILAMSCAAVAVFAIVYFVNLNMPDLSLRVAAMQTGINASYPSYVPRDFTLSDITSENGKVTLNFKNSSTGDAFSLVEESSSWDSNALLANYVAGEYGDEYDTVREQGLTLYMSGGDACWVNGGVVYKIKTLSGSLTKKQIKTIATSL